MSQEEIIGPLVESVGYQLKRTTSTLHAAMDRALREWGLTVSQYSCLEVLGQHPKMSNSELARSVFVSRQAMNGVLRGLQDRGLVTRPAAAAHGRTLPNDLTRTGREKLHAASAAVRAVEKQMLAPLTSAAQRRLLDDLVGCAQALIGSSTET